MLIEQDQGIRSLYLLENQFAFCRFLLFFREAFRVLEFWNHHEFEGHIVTDATDIVVDACLEMFVVGLTHED